MLVLDELDRPCDIVGGHCLADMQIGEKDQAQTLLGLLPFGRQAMHDQRAINHPWIAHVAVPNNHCPDEDSKCHDESQHLRPLLHSRASRSVKAQRPCIYMSQYIHPDDEGSDVECGEEDVHAPIHQRTHPVGFDMPMHEERDGEEDEDQ